MFEGFPSCPPLAFLIASAAFVPLGYDVKDRKLVVNTKEAATVLRIFERFTKVGSVTELVRELRADEARGKRGRLIDKGYVYQLFRNRTYIGEAVHKGTSYRGEHEPIISNTLWDKVYGILREGPRQSGATNVFLAERSGPGACNALWSAFDQFGHE